MSDWTHPVCDNCYGELEGGRRPVVLKPEFRSEEFCCNCGEFTDEGIYYRADPSDMPECTGGHR